MTQKFGEIEVPDNKIITMIKPILGFESLTKFCLVENEEMLPFLWLQAIEEGSVSFIVVNPKVLVDDYNIEVNKIELAELEIDQIKSVETYVIATIPDDPMEMSVNLQGPILINTENNFGKQLVLVNSKYNVCYNVMDAVECEKEAEVIQREEVIV
ncbi:MAG: flagellar assembly protein FliW [candidate division Zixibacteria bacterium]|nr:flagellar assembly protein FliW [candidate division Zixibacteria bacterium]